MMLEDRIVVTLDILDGEKLERTGGLCFLILGLLTQYVHFIKWYTYNLYTFLLVCEKFKRKVCKGLCLFKNN